MLPIWIELMVAMLIVYAAVLTLASAAFGWWRGRRVFARRSAARASRQALHGSRSARSARPGGSRGAPARSVEPEAP